MPLAPKLTFFSFIHFGSCKQPPLCEKQLFRLMLTFPGSTVVGPGFTHVQFPHKWLRCHFLLMKSIFLQFRHCMKQNFGNYSKIQDKTISAISVLPVERLIYFATRTQCTDGRYAGRWWSWVKPTFIVFSKGIKQTIG